MTANKSPKAYMIQKNDQTLVIFRDRGDPFCRKPRCRIVASGSSILDVDQNAGLSDPQTAVARRIRRPGGTGDLGHQPIPEPGNGCVGTAHEIKTSVTRFHDSRQIVVAETFPGCVGGDVHVSKTVQPLHRADPEISLPIFGD